MFINRLVEKANKSTNTTEVNKIRKNMIWFGSLGMFFGILGVIACLLFSLIMFYDTLINPNNFSFPFFVIPLCLMILFGTFAVLGIISLVSGLSLVIVQKTSEFIDENVYCPKCNNMTGTDKFCNKCGASVLKDRICNTCKTLNDVEALFCKECGKDI